jgi:NAD+ synthase
VANLKKHFQCAGFKKAVVGLSGGVDSALTLFLAVQALGAKNVTALLLPEEGVSSFSNQQDALNLAKQLKVDYFKLTINSLLDCCQNLPWKSSSLASMNTSARVRMLFLYHFANSNQALVLGTSNKTELLLGYGTKHGDFAVDLEVLGDLWKTEVFALAKDLKLPEVFCTKTPTAELQEGQTDEAEIGASYNVIDRILQNYLNKTSQIDDSQLVEQILRRVQLNQHKTKLAPVINSTQFN